MATKRRGAGTKVRLGSSADPLTATFTAIPSIKSFSVKMSTGEQEVTDLDSSAKEFLRDLPDGGRATMNIYFDPLEATHAEISGLEALFNSGETRLFQYLPNGATKYRQVAGFVISDGSDFDPNQPMMKDVEVRITGGRTYVTAP